MKEQIEKEKVATVLSDSMSKNLFEAYTDSLSKDNKVPSNSNDSYIKLIKHWCYRQLSGLFPLRGEREEVEEEKGGQEESSYNLSEHWPTIKRHLILYGKCVSLELGGDIVVARIITVTRNLSNRILSVQVQLEDKESTKLTLFTSFGEKIKNKELIKLKEELKNKNWILKQFEVGSHHNKIENLEKELLEGSKKFIFWKNNFDETPEMMYITPILEDLQQIREDMIWDRKRSRKQVIVSAAKRPSDAAWAATKTNLEQDYVCLIYPEEELVGNSFKAEIKDHEKQQKDLWEDHNKTFDFLRRMIGITHNTNKKKERQNNPEMEMIENQFLTFQQEKREYLELGIREWIELFGGNWELVPIEMVEASEEEEEDEEEKKDKKIK